MRKTVLILSWIFFICLNWACQNDDEDDVDYTVKELDVETTRNYTKGEELFYDINAFAETIWKRRDADSLLVCDYSDLTAAVVTCTSNEVKISYGSNGIIDRDGMYRKGGIVFKFDKKYQEDSASCFTQLFSYQEDTIAIGGNSTLTFLSHDSLTNTDSVHYLLEDGALDFGNGQKCEWTASKIRINKDEKHYFYGEAEGKNTLSNLFTINIQEPEVVLSSCEYSKNIPIQGVTNISFAIDSSGLVPREIDYGTGDCDAVVTVKIGELLYDVVLE